MVGRTADVVAEGHAAKLRTDDDEILRQAAVAKQTARLTPRGDGGCVYEIGEAADVAGSDERIGAGGFPQRLRCRQCCAIDKAGSTQCHTLEDLVHERNVILSSSNGIERGQDTVFENVGVVE